MKKTDLLIKIFDKAEAGGYQIDAPAPIDKVLEYGIYFKFIYTHGFLKAYFGSAWINEKNEPLVLEAKKQAKIFVDMQGYKPAWVYHAQQMVIAKDPLKYLEQYL